MTQEDVKRKRRGKRSSEDNSAESLLNQELNEVEAEKKPVRKIPFSVWFDRMLKKGKVKFWQEEPLLVFVQKQGLSQAEAEDSYNEVLKRF